MQLRSPSTPKANGSASRYCRHPLQTILLFYLLPALFFFTTMPHAYALQEAEPKRPAAWAEPMNLLGSENFYRINRDLYRAAQPGRLGMLVYEGFGIRSVINLRALHSDKDEMGNTRLNLIEIPMHAWDAGNDQYVIKVLQAIRDARKPVLLHCRHGADRTGLMIAMYRIVEEGWDKNDAIRELREGGYGFHSIWRNIPSYIEQVDVNALRKALR